MSTGSDLAETAKALATPANTLIEKISNAIGAVFEPHQIVRLAKAESKAAIIKANTQIELTDIQRRAMHRMLEEETRKQINIENVTKNALPYVQENAEPDKISNDWVINFFEKSQILIYYFNRSCKNRIFDYFSDGYYIFFNILYIVFIF